MKERGFTLIELMVVVVIIGVLAAVAMPRYLRQARKGREAAAWADLASFAEACEYYLLDCLEYPTNLFDIDDPIGSACTAGVGRYLGPYISFRKGGGASAPQDPWGQDYTYTTATDPPRFCSLGEYGDGVPHFIDLRGDGTFCIGP